MKRVILLALAFICFLALTISPTLAQDPNYVLVWSDEFDIDGAPDATKWYHQTQFPVGDSWFNGELQHYTDEAANSFVESGVLKIVAKKEPYLDQGVTKDYTSARLNSKYAFTYGRVEVRAKLPSGAGTWPAFWTLGKNINENGGFWDATYGTTDWPACGEIDIMEHWGSNQNVVQSAMHTPSSFGGTINKGDQTIATASTEFHVYGMEWDEDKIVFDVDGVVHYTYEPVTKDASTWPFDADQYILLNTAIEGNIGTVNPTFTEATMEIDYVRVYENMPLSGSDVLAEGFDASTSVDDWTLAGDAATNPSEVTLVWNETGGVDGGGAMDFTAANSDGVNARSFILQKSFTGLDFSSAPEIDISLDIKGDITDANVNLLVQVLGAGGQLDQRSIQSEINNSTFSSVTYTLSSIPSGLTEFFVQFNIATGPVIGQGGNLIIDNITVTPSGGGGGGTDPVLPTAGPTAPTEDAGDVISIYSDSYADVSNSGFANYGAATFEQVDLGGNNALRYTLAGVDGGNFQVIELGGANQIDASGAGMTNFRFDAWFPETVDGATSLLVKVVDIGGSTTEAALTINTSSTPAMAQGEWLSYDFSLADLASAGIGSTNNIQQVVVDVANTTDVYLDNIYFYNDGSGGGGTDPVLPTAGPTAPTEDAGDVISIYSDSYADVSNSGFANYGAATFEQVDLGGNNALRYTLAGVDGGNFQVIELGGANQIDASGAGMTNFRFDAWFPEAVDGATSLLVKVVDIGGSTTEAALTINTSSTPAMAQGQWLSYDFSLADLASAGIGATSNIQQVVIDVANTPDVYLDNIYFYDNGSGGGGGTPTTDVLAEGFDASTSVDDWTLAGDAATNPSEVTLVWNETGGVDGGGAMDFTAANSDGVNARSFILQKSFTGLDFSNAPEIDISLDIKGDITDANVNLLVQVLGAGGQLDQRSIQSEINNSTFSSVTYTLSSIPSGLTEFFVQFNIATGPVIGQGGNLIIDNITVTPSGGGGGGGGTDPVLPTAGPTAPTEDAGDVISIYSDSYADVSNSGFANYGAATFEQVDLGGNNALRYTLAGVDGGNFQVIELGGANQIDASGAGMTNFRFDAWFPEAVDGATSLLVKVVDIGGSTTEAALTINTSSTPAMAQGQWLSYDFSLADLASAGIGATSNIQQVVIDVANTPDVYLDNIYFYDNGSGGGGGTPTTDVLAEGFDASTSVDDWTLAGDAATNPSEVTLVWNETGGVDGGGAMDFTAANSDGVNARSFILQKSFTGLDFSNAPEIDISLDIKGDITDANVNLLVQVLGAGGQLDQRSIQSEINNSTFSSVTYTLSSIPSGLTEFFVQFNIATGPVIGQGGNLIIDNITVTPSGGGGGGGGTDPVLPTAGPTAPTEDAGDVISIYSDSYADVSNSGFANYGAATFEQVDLGGNNALRYTLAGVDGGNFQVIELGGANQIDASGAGMTNFRFDAWFPETVDGATSLLVKVVDIGGSTTEAALTINTSSTPAMAQGQWLSYDFSLADLGSAGIGATSNIQQVVIDVANTPDVYLDNIYFYNSAGSGGGGGGGTDPVLPTAGPTAPTEDAGDVISIFSDSYANVSNSGFANYGAATFEQADLGGNSALRYTLAGVDGGNFQVIELGGANQIDASGAGMTNFRFDAWFPEAVDGATSLLVKVVDIAGSTTEASLTINTSSTPAMAQGEWLSYDFSLADLGSAGIGGTSNIQQVVIDVANTPDVYLDNIYFYNADGSGGGGGGGSEEDYCEQTVYNNSNDAETASAALLTIENVDASSMKVTITSADDDPVDALIVNNSSGPITGSPGVSAADDSVPGELSVTLTWTDTPPTDVELNVLWSKVSFEGNWQLVTPPANITVAFDKSCDGGGSGGGDPVGLPVDFESSTLTYTFGDFEGGVTTVIDNPQSNGINTSSKVAQTVKGAGQVFAGTTLQLDEPIDFGDLTAIKVKVYSPRADVPLTFKLESSSGDGNDSERIVAPTTANTWEELEFNFADNIRSDYTGITLIWDNGTAGDGSADWTFLVDDIEVAESSAPGSDASLSSLLVDDVSVNRFDPETFEYFVLLPEGTATDAIPTVTAATTDAAASFEVTDPTELPGFATVLVTAEDGTTTSTYSIEYKIDENLSKIATLSDLQVGGTSIESFDPEVFAYAVELDETVTAAPEVVGVAADANASVVVEDAISLPGTTKVIVTAEDGVTVRNYAIDFTYPEGTAVTFSVTGTVTADGAPFSSGTVVIYDTDNITNSKTTSLAADGTYSITSLEEGSYNVYVDSDSEDFVTTFYGNVSSVTDANAVPLTLVMDRNRVADVAMVAKPVSAVEMLGEDEGATIGFQAQSVSGGSGSRIVTGRVSQGEGLANVLVILNTADDEYVADGITDSDGFITFTGIPTGDYKLIVDVPGVGRVSSEISAVEGEESEFTGLIDESGIFINQVLGLEEELLQDMKVYPNPAVERLSIEVPNGLIVRDYTLTIVSLSGQTFNIPARVRERSIDVDVSQLESGVYIIRLTTETGTADRRFIKQ